jgi:hypothetical protein
LAGRGRVGLAAWLRFSTVQKKETTEGVLRGREAAGGHDAALTQTCRRTDGRTREVRVSTVSRDLPGQPFLLGFGRSPFVIYQFGLKFSYSCLQVSEFSQTKGHSAPKHKAPGTTFESRALASGPASSGKRLQMSPPPIALHRGHSLGSLSRFRIDRQTHASTCCHGRPAVFAFT